MTGELLLAVIGVIMGILTSYTDIKTGFIEDRHVFPTFTYIERLFSRGEVEDTGSTGLFSWVILPAAEIGLLYYLVRGLSEGNVSLALSGLAGLIAGFLLGYFLYFIGGWAGGDVLILAAFSALFPYASSYAMVRPFYATEYPLHAVTLLFNSIIAIFPFILLYALGVLIARGEGRKLTEVFTENIRLTVEGALWVMAAITFIIIMASAVGVTLNPIIRYVLTLVLLFVLGKYRVFGDALGLFALAYGTYTIGTEFLYVFGKLLLTFYAFKLFFSVVKVLRTEVLMEEKPLEEIREWDIIGEWIYEKDGELRRDREGFLDRLRKGILTGDLSILNPDYGNIIVSPTAEGIKKEQIDMLRVLVEEGKLENRFLVKKAMPFAPALFLGFLISILYGDIFWWLFLRMAGL